MIPPNLNKELIKVKNGAIKMNNSNEVAIKKR
jgi:hypothetical protein